MTRPRTGAPRILLRRSRRGALARAVLSGAAALLGVSAALLAYAHLAPLTPLGERAPTAGTLIVDRHGEPLLRDVSDGMHIPVRLDAVAPIAVAATIAAEDQRFWHHPGVDPLALARAATDALATRSRPRGASTLTQQIARRLYLADDDAPALLRKAREALVALQLEARLPKQDLLAAYLNHVYYGRGAYGIEAAARRYFGVSARHLDLSQASYLAGLPQSPARYGGEQATADALARQRYVLGRLAATGVITSARAREAASYPLGFAGEQDDALAPHFAAMVLDEVASLRPESRRQARTRHRDDPRRDPPASGRAIALAPPRAHRPVGREHRGGRRPRRGERRAARPRRQRRLRRGGGGAGQPGAGPPPARLGDEAAALRGGHRARVYARLDAARRAVQLRHPGGRLHARERRPPLPRAGDAAHRARLLAQRPRRPHARGDRRGSAGPHRASRRAARDRRTGALRALARARLGRGDPAQPHLRLRRYSERRPPGRAVRGRAGARRRHARGPLRARAARGRARDVARARVPARRHPERSDRAGAGVRRGLGAGGAVPRRR